MSKLAKSGNIFSKTGNFVSNHPVATVAGTLTTVHEIQKGKRVFHSLAKGAAVTTGVAVAPIVAKVALQIAAVAAPIFVVAAVGKSIGNGLLSLLMTGKERVAHFKLDYCLQRFSKAKTKEDSNYWLQEAMKASAEFSRALKEK